MKAENLNGGSASGRLSEADRHAGRILAARRVAFAASRLGNLPGSTRASSLGGGHETTCSVFGSLRPLSSGARRRRRWPRRIRVKLDYYTATVSQERYRDLLAKGTDMTSRRRTSPGGPARTGAHTAAGRSLEGTGRQRRPAPQQGPDGSPGGRVPGFERVQCLARLRRGRRHRRDMVTHSRRGTRRSRSSRSSGRPSRARDLRAQADPGRHARRDGKRPAVLYSSTQHAREWISAEVNRRLMHWYVDSGARTTRRSRTCSRRTSSGSCSSPTRTATSTRSRAPTRGSGGRPRDNNGNGTIEVGDGVDPNRNYEEHWGYDDEGSSPFPSSDTYRGPGPGVRARDAGDRRPL